MLRSIGGWGLAFLIALLGAASAQVSGEQSEDTAKYFAEDYDRPGFYLGLAATFAIDYFDIDEIKKAAELNLDATNSWGLNARAGYRLHPNVAAELGFEYYQGFDLNGPEGGDVVEISGWSLMANGKGYVLTGPAQPYGLIGVGMLYLDRNPSFSRTVFNPRGDFRQDQQDLAFATRFGVGVDLYAFRDVVFNTEYAFTLPTGDLNDFWFTSLSFGLQYRF